MKKAILYLILASGMIYLTIHERGPIYKTYEDAVLAYEKLFDEDNYKLREQLSLSELIYEELTQRLKKEKNCTNHDEALGSTPSWHGFDSSSVSEQNKKTIERLRKHRSEWEFSAGLCYSKKNEYQNIRKANEHFLNAALEGQPRAQVALGLNYRLGNGFESDDKSALHWFMEAANNGDDRGLYWVGICYKEGRGVTANPDLAKQYFVRSYNATNNEEFKVLLDSLIHDSRDVPHLPN